MTFRRPSDAANLFRRPSDATFLGVQTPRKPPSDAIRTLQTPFTHIPPYPPLACAAPLKGGAHARENLPAWFRHENLRINKEQRISCLHSTRKHLAGLRDSERVAFTLLPKRSQEFNV